MKIIATTIILLCVATFAQQKGSFIDPRDGKTYKTTKIGKQIWMAENLNYATSGGKCYDNKTLYCDKYGRLYDWETAMIVCPKGWHLPSNAEWGVLKKRAESTCSSAGNCISAGIILKATSGWIYDDNGTDAFGFAALPSGVGLLDYPNVGDTEFYNVGSTGGWWSASVQVADNDYQIIGSADLIYSGRGKEGYKPALYSVRCVKD